MLFKIQDPNRSAEDPSGILVLLLANFGPRPTAFFFFAANATKFSRFIILIPTGVFRPDIVCITKREKAESEAQRSKPKGTLESEIRNAIS